MMTTIHHLKGEEAEVLKDRNRPGRKSKNYKRALEEFGDQQRKEIPIPVAIYDYNFHMGGVDIADQCRTYYDTQLRVFRTWFPIFFWALDTALINAFIVFNDLDFVQAIAHKEFWLQTVWDLILEGSKEVEGEGGKKRKSIIDSTEHPTKKAKYVTKSTGLPPHRSNGEHLPEFYKGQEKECWLCRYRLKEAANTEVIEGGSFPGGRGYRTQWKCSTCELPLCINSSSSYFI